MTLEMRQQNRAKSCNGASQKANIQRAWICNCFFSIHTWVNVYVMITLYQ